MVTFVPDFFSFFFFFLSYNCDWHNLLNSSFREFIDYDWYFWNVTDIFYVDFLLCNIIKFIYQLNFFLDH